MHKFVCVSTFMVTPMLIIVDSLSEGAHETFGTVTCSDLQWPCYCYGKILEVINCFLLMKGHSHIKEMCTLCGSKTLYYLLLCTNEYYIIIMSITLYVPV